MKRYAILLALLLALPLTACGTGGAYDTHIHTAQDKSERQLQIEAGTGSASGSGEPQNEEEPMNTNQLYIRVGENVLTAVLEDSPSADALKELLADDPLTISAANYGGFEKVCALGTALPRNDSQTTTQAGDICLYNGDQIVIFHGSNSWAYTRLGRILDTDASELQRILNGPETEITLSLAAFGE